MFSPVPIELSLPRARQQRIALHQLLLAKRELAQALAGRGKDRVVERRGHERYSRLAGPGGQGILICYEVHHCTRIRVLALYKRRSAANSLLFLEKVVEEFPFPIQRIQTDCGREFLAYAFQEKLMEYGIKFRPLKPASPP